MSGRISAFEQRIGRILPERRIYVRGDGTTRYFTLSPMSQVGGLVLAAGILGWTAFASLSFLGAAVDSRRAEARLDATRAAYEIRIAALKKHQRALESELGRSVARGDKVTSVLSAKQRLLVRTAARLQNAEIELSGLRRAYRGLLGTQRANRDRVNALNEEITTLRLAMIDRDRRGGTDALTARAFAVTMAAVLDERDRAARRAGVLGTRVAVLSRKLGKSRRRQETMIARIETATRTSLGKLDALFVGTKVDLKDILKRTRRDYTGRGGPDDGGGMAGSPVAGRAAGSPVTAAVGRHVRAVAPDAASAAAGSRGDSAARSAAATPEQRLAALMADLERMSLLRIAVDRLPFGMPTRGAERTSGFGYRRDPYRRRSRLHKGIDFAAPTGTPIYSTAQGVVVFSGRKRGYGIVVKIRHAFGFETVYAHLSKSRVTVGQRVGRGERIADMGNTGRSTGSHLHYEVRVNGTPINPVKFIRAPRNVL